MGKFLRSEKGQTSIFVALVFQVLFVLFAMALNIGMVVHDKINLQNSVDLAAYYAAQKQAEWLNVIGHTNYQIRQSFKLFAFRYKVLGTMGMDGAGSDKVLSPTFQPSKLDEELWPYAEEPYACISQSRHWNTYGATDDNICRTLTNYIPPIPTIAVIDPFNPINMLVSAYAAKMRDQVNKLCAYAGAYNWYWAAASAQSFRMDQFSRLQAINAFSGILASDDPKDIDGAPISVGAKNTLVKNLTVQNEAGLQSFRMYNSLRGTQREEWLPKVRIMPFVNYIDSTTGAGCQGQRQVITELPVRESARTYLDTELKARDLMSWMNTMNTFITGNDYSYSLGVEKNPWVMAYVGVEARTVSRPIFYPFGSGVELVARAYAKPFGGSIGPWYSKTWPNSANQSYGDRIDKKVPARLSPDGSFLDADDKTRLPDFAKYPGDHYGMTSYLSQNAFNRIGSQRFEIQWYSDVWKNIDSSQPLQHDRLAWDHKENKSPNVRAYEIAALAPDLFDITYYAIEPNFPGNYLNRIIAAKSELGLPESLVLRPDLGHRHQAQGLTNFSVQDQLKVAEEVDPALRLQPRIREAFYFVRDKTDLLTWWMSGPNYGQEGNNSEIFPEYFGECQFPDDGAKITAPGSCLSRGGRTGYSVKLVSGEALASDQWPIGGGKGSEKGAIRNPPISDNWLEF